MIRLSELKTTVEAHTKGIETSLAAQIQKVDASLDARIKGQVIQGIAWGMGIVGGIIAAVFTLLKYFGGQS